MTAPLPLDQPVPSALLSPAFLIDMRARADAQHQAMDTVICGALGCGLDALLQVLGERFHYPTARLGVSQLSGADLRNASLAECRKRRVLFLPGEAGRTGYFSDPSDPDLAPWGGATGGAVAAWILVLDSELQANLDHLEGNASALTSALGSGEASDGDVAQRIEQISYAALDGAGSPVVRLVSSTLYDALQAGASDIHLESLGNGLVVKYRIDGVLVEVGRREGRAFSEQVVSRIKVMAELDITERRIPQDGRFKARVKERDIDFRVSVMPSVFGEDVVIRILDKESLSDQISGLTLEHLGFDEHTKRVIRSLAREPHGMLLVTGPTGSGKTTTLYAALTEINDGRDKIVTIEDPVEYQLPGVLQIPVNERKGLTFARGLRSILRHDPDKIMVGEIRDNETAQISVQAALTGHLVFSTIHANNVFDVLNRFEHMQVDPYSMVSALNGIIAQRLVRMVCDACAESVAPVVGVSGLQNRRRGIGCKECRGSGYRGRRAIGECLVLDDELREHIAAKAPLRTIKDVAKRQGTRLLRQSAEGLVERGLTTMEEINRVTFAR